MKQQGRMNISGNLNINKLIAVVTPYKTYGNLSETKFQHEEGSQALSSIHSVGAIENCQLKGEGFFSKSIGQPHIQTI